MRLLAFILLVGAGAAVAAQSSPLALKSVIPLPNVEGRIDHLAFDGSRGRLYVAALGNNSVEVTDTVNGIHVTTLPGFHEPQGIAVIPLGDATNAIAVANGNSGTLQIIDTLSYQTRRAVSIGGDADNVRYDQAAKRLYVAYEGGLAVVDPATGQVVQRIAIQGHPESFQLEREGSRVFVNLPDSAKIVVADRKTGSGEFSDGARRIDASSFRRVPPAGDDGRLRYGHGQSRGDDADRRRHGRFVLRQRPQEAVCHRRRGVRGRAAA
jgi:DNA-binding beta-propeller fold protein YncE